jgi:hypothetical protein
MIIGYLILVYRGQLANPGKLNKLPFPQNPKQIYGTFLVEPPRVPRLSIVIPVLGRCNLLDDTLVSVLENRPADCEIVVVHNGPYDDPYGLAGEVRFLQAGSEAGLAECLNLGLSASRAAVIHVLACGVEVFAGWADVALRHFREPRTGALGAVILRRNDLRKVVSGGVSCRIEGAVSRLGEGQDAERLVGEYDGFSGPDVAAAFYRKSAVEAAGGFGSWTDAELIGADVALKIGQSGFRLVLERQCLARSEPAVLRRASAFRLGCESERFFWRWAAGHRRLPSVAGHAALVVGECVIAIWRPAMLVRLAGRACGAVSAVGRSARPKPPQDAAGETPPVLSSRDFAPAANCRAKGRKAKAA